MAQVSQAQAWASETTQSNEGRPGPPVPEMVAIFCDVVGGPEKAARGCRLALLAIDKAPDVGAVVATVFKSQAMGVKIV